METGEIDHEDSIPLPESTRKERNPSERIEDHIDHEVEEERQEEDREVVGGLENEA